MATTTYRRCSAKPFGSPTSTARSAPWPAAVARTPAALIGLPARGRIAPGAPADLVLLKARGCSELLARPQADRVVLRASRSVDPTPPDYRALDEGSPNAAVGANLAGLTTSA